MIDNNYSKFGILDANGQITDLGKLYGMYLISRTQLKNRNDPTMNNDTWIWVEPCPIPNPKNLFNNNYAMLGDNEPLSPRGLQWFRNYIETHDFNPYFYALASCQDMSVILAIC
jgi:hypothetical protein